MDTIRNKNDEVSIAERRQLRYIILYRCAKYCYCV